MKRMRGVVLASAVLGFLPVALRAQVVHEGKPLDYWVDQIAAGNYFGGVYQAFEDLGCGAAPAVPRLLELLKDPKVADNAASVLGMIGDASVLPVFTERLASADRYDRLRACSVIGSISAAERGGFDHGRKRLRCSAPAVKLTQTIGPTVSPLIRILADDEHLVSECAHAVLAGMGSFPVVSLVGAARDAQRSTELRAAAVRTLGMIGPAAIDALPALRKLVSTPDEDALIRGEANAAVLKIERRAP